MNQLMDRLADFGEPTTGTPSDEVVAADMRRVHASLARRRQKIGAVSLAVLAIAGIGSAGAAGALGTGRSPTSASVSAAGSHLKLVAYTGKQPTGFRLSVIPQGYHVTYSNEDFVDPAPTGEKRSYIAPGTITIARVDGAGPLNSGEAGNLSYERKNAQPAQVNGHMGYYRVYPALKDGPFPGRVVSLEWNNGTYDLNVFSTLGELSEAQLVQLADGVTTVGSVPSGPLISTTP